MAVQAGREGGVWLSERSEPRDGCGLPPLETSGAIAPHPRIPRLRSIVGHHVWDDVGMLSRRGR